MCTRRSKNFFIITVFILFLSTGCAVKRWFLLDGESKLPEAQSDGIVISHNPTDEQTFNQARIKTEEGLYDQGIALWRIYFQKTAGLPHLEEAQFLFSLCLAKSESLDHHHEAQDLLKQLIENKTKSYHSFESRILLGELYIEDKKYEEALGLTFDLLPNISNEKNSGLQRSDSAPFINSRDKIRLTFLRARALTHLSRFKDSITELKKIENLSRVAQLSIEDKEKTKNQLAFYKIKNLRHWCPDQVPKPTLLSETEFIEYTDKLYECSLVAKKSLCEIYKSTPGAKSSEIFEKSKQEYLALMSIPLELKEPLPPPARKLKKKEQKSFYENEMKILINVTVDNALKDFKNGAFCDFKS